MDAHVWCWVKFLKTFYFFKYMPFEDDPPHRFSQFLLFWLYKQYLKCPLQLFMWGIKVYYFFPLIF